MAVTRHRSIDQIDSLTRNQLELVRWLADGKDTPQIAEIMGASGKQAIHMRIHRIKEKLGTNTIGGTVAYALRKGLIT